MMQQEYWIADRAALQRLLQLHPEWTQEELANWIGRSKGWVKKWKKHLREAPPGDVRVLFGKPFCRITPYPQTDPEVEERIVAIRDAPPENLKRTPGPRAILYYLPRDPHLQHLITGTAVNVARLLDWLAEVPGCKTRTSRFAALAA